MFVSCNYGPGVLKHSLPMNLDLLLEIGPDKLAHKNGGTTASSWKKVKDLIDKTSMPLEIIAYGNLKSAVQIVDYLKNKNRLHRLIVGSDTPTGQGCLPVAVQRAVIFLSSVYNIPAEKAIAMATGNTSYLYGRRINTGKIGPGKEADLVIIDISPGSAGEDALKAIEAGDTFGVAFVIVDEDIDVHNEQEVNWAIATRMQPDRDVNIVKNVFCNKLDPSSYEDGTTGKLIIDATKKKGIFDTLTVPKNFKEKAVRKAKEK